MITIRQGQSSPLRNELLTEQSVGYAAIVSDTDTVIMHNIATLLTSQGAKLLSNASDSALASASATCGRCQVVRVMRLYSLTPMTPQFNCTITGDNWQGRSRVSPHISCEASQQSAVCLFYD